MSGRRSLLVAFVFLGAALAPWTVGVAERPDPGPTYGPQDLWGSIFPAAGWGFISTGITNPGPEISVTPSELVQLVLHGADAALHSFWVDYNGDNFTAGEPVSGTFGGAVPLNHNFAASPTPGKYWYKCGIHGMGMAGPFTIRTVSNLPPTIQLTNPDGVAQNRWTGGSTQRLTWVPFDPDDPLGFLTVWLNFSYNAGANLGTIMGPYVGAPSFPWSVPRIDANDVHVLAEIYDPRGGKGTDDRLIPIIDSTAPTVMSHSPVDNAVGVLLGSPVVVNFSEPMNTAATEPAITFNPSPGGFSFTWSNGNQTVTVGHSPFLPRTTYTVTVGTGATDTSNPGNPLGSGVPFSWSFTTFDAPPIVSITAPVGGERWTGGTAHTISPVAARTVQGDRAASQGRPRCGASAESTAWSC